MGMMTIDEAIKHCIDKTDCTECGKEHGQLAKWLEELKVYKDAEEQGLLIRLPCKVGDPIVCVEEYEDGYDYSTYLLMATCGDFVIVTPRLFRCNNFDKQLHDMCEESQEWERIDACLFHRSRVFLSKEEAEKALERMGNNGKS